MDRMPGVAGQPLLTSLSQGCAVICRKEGPPLGQGMVTTPQRPGGYMCHGGESLDGSVLELLRTLLMSMLLPFPPYGCGHVGPQSYSPVYTSFSSPQNKTDWMVLLLKSGLIKNIAFIEKLFYTRYIAKWLQLHYFV